MMEKAKLTWALLGAFLAFGALAEPRPFEKVPRSALQALKVSVGRPIRTGMVFVNGKYLPPPYKVERYGTAIRINEIQVTDQLISWNEFVKTQSGAVRSETPAAPSEPEPAQPSYSSSSSSSSSDALDDLFDDVPSTSRPAARAPRPASPAPAVTYTMDGEFVPNAKSNALLSKLNSARTEIDANLRKGGFCCFGTAYSRVIGDSGVARSLLGKLPEFQKDISETARFRQAMRSAGFAYFPEPLMDDFLRNHIDYLQLRQRLKKVLEEEKWNKTFEEGMLSY